ncbi:Uncharacterised protein [Mycobacteroides abscessus subsp. bolletii]|uniref:hypothetical protein n=1 Tax=Mycobacteroides abscessus TaxID=36809 RepID=UPI000929F09C|nr:hypothetical protein [Mycobacteroides abscessus]SHX32167.1 Uncharacterised protein [Mycobacteroides abscessus subsp. bolletii]SKP58295.1 Uncharacterised protein [Mycobacteroides abscessus subsp. bolletii]SKP80710.1 Uncharacterised protein [Mycobacteroides abscessus subsp. bolletii]SKQ36497.1 Uncharacterised protein [Mycobacteroides abscessus subsp. bolletii]
MGATDLDTLESEVGAEYAELVAERMPENPFNIDDWFDPVDWSNFKRSTDRRDAIGPEYPREQWMVYPGKRMVTLLLVRNVIRLIREKPDHPRNEELFQQTSFLFMYGGKVRIA